jgi:hypothetical protein
MNLKRNKIPLRKILNPPHIGFTDNIQELLMPKTILP